MKEIKITKGYYALVDDEDFDYLDDIHWHYCKGYARTRGIFLMHRMVLRADKYTEVDHINGNKLDNRKCNLRITDRFGNTQHVSVRKDNSTGFKGVFISNRYANRPYVASIQYNKKRVYLGCFDTAFKAALAYNEAAIRFHGKYAVLNTVKETAK